MVIGSTSGDDLTNDKQQRRVRGSEHTYRGIWSNALNDNANRIDEADGVMRRVCYRKTRKI
jgi:hypothetical protein